MDPVLCSDGRRLGAGLGQRRALEIGDRPPAAGTSNGGIAMCPRPVTVLGLTGPVVGVSTHEMQTCAAYAAGAAACWGSNDYGVLGLSQTVPPHCRDTDGDGVANVCTAAAPVAGF